ncbi:hypothetical protein JMJ56_16850 [Belnapia sp. T18]|uniref:Uncharacterized protein n=1 Tax=Belnapia arida TaxID=2804533 RepID=A0ABS1U6X4_9PROT|nr:hypothetical protein [Belnapia arida]MBL6079689.1 hypothetical protein [Belnapia arida]
MPPGERRNPVAMVRLAVGPLTLLLPVSRLRKAGLAVRLPMGEGGVPAVEADAATWDTSQQATIGAVMLDQAAREHLFGPDLRKMDRATLKALREAGVIPPPASAEVVPLRPGAALA